MKKELRFGVPVVKASHLQYTLDVKVVELKDPEGGLSLEEFLEILAVRVRAEELNTVEGGACLLTGAIETSEGFGFLLSAETIRVATGAKVVVKCVEEKRYIVLAASDDSGHKVPSIIDSKEIDNLNKKS